MPTRGTRKLMAKSNTATTHMQMKEGGKKRMMDTKKTSTTEGIHCCSSTDCGNKTWVFGAGTCDSGSLGREYLHSQAVIRHRHAGVAMPTNMHGFICTMVRLFIQ